MPAALPRYELHCHLDGSVRVATLRALLADLSRDESGWSEDQIRRRAVAPSDVGSLTAFLPFIDIALLALQSAEALTRAARELVHDWAADGVAYGEARFAPQLHLTAGLTLDDALVAVADGLRQGESDTGVASGLIACCLRHQEPETSVAVSEAAVRNPGIVAGLDLAGDERYSGAAHVEAFDIARRAGLGVTVHAGEAAGPESVWEAVDVLGATRIGHGVRSVLDPVLVRRLAVDGICLETCPRCNVLTRAVPSMRAHPIAQLLEQGVPVTVSTDTRTTADTSLAQEFAALRSTFRWGATEEQQVQAYAARAAFGANAGSPRR